MTVGELIASLRKYPADMGLLVQSYEEGYDLVTEVKPIRVSEKPDKQWYAGMYNENTQSEKTMLLIQSRHNRADKEDI